jgi:serine/threonine protein kinase
VWAPGPGARPGFYEVVAWIGGGMGEVYRARDASRLDRTAAIKVLPEHPAKDAERRQRFEREAKALGALSHPDSCAAFDVGTRIMRTFVRQHERTAVLCPRSSAEADTDPDRLS